MVEQRTSPVILVVEDEAIICECLTDVLSDHGMQVVGPYRSNQSALAYLETGKPDAAIIDLNLHDGVSARIAERLTDLDIPFLIISGETKEGRYDPALERVEWLDKPFSETALVTRTGHLLSSP